MSGTRTVRAAAQAGLPGGLHDGGGTTNPRYTSPYLLVEDVAARLHVSTRTVHELTRTNGIPHRRLPGTRRCLFLEGELQAWEDGVALEVVELARGGRVVTPRTQA